MPTDPFAFARDTNDYNRASPSPNVGGGGVQLSACGSYTTTPIRHILRFTCPSASEWQVDQVSGSQPGIQT